MIWFSHSSLYFGCKIKQISQLYRENGWVPNSYAAGQMLPESVMKQIIYASPVITAPVRDIFSVNLSGPRLNIKTVFPGMEFPL